MKKARTILLVFVLYVYLVFPLNVFANSEGLLNEEVELPAMPSSESTTGKRQKLEMLYFRFVDKNELPVEYLNVNGTLSDENGLLEITSDLLEIPMNNGTINLVALDMFSNQKKSYEVKSISHDAQKPIVLRWDFDTPRESASKQKDKVLFRVVDSDGRAVQGVEFTEFTMTSTPEDQKALSVNYPILPTDKNGKTYYTGKAIGDCRVTLVYNGISKKFRLNLSSDNLEKNKIYKFILK